MVHAYFQLQIWLCPAIGLVVRPSVMLYSKSLLRFLECEMCQCVKGEVVSPSHQNRNNIVNQGHFLPIPLSFIQDFLKTDHFEWGTNNAHRWMERRTDRRADGPTKRAVESRSTRLKKLHNIAEWTSLCNRCNICSFSSQDMTHINNYGTGR